MKDIQVTLYDVFGYVFPGAAFAAALYLFYWAVFPTYKLDLTSVTGAGWTVLLVVAYTLGHVVQALTNSMKHLCRRSAVDRALGTTDEALPAEVAKAAKTKARSMIGVPEWVALKPQTVFDICDHYVMQEGQTATRDVLVYREGFYRGMAAILPLLACALVVRAFEPGDIVVKFGSAFERQFMQRELAVLAVGICLVAAAFYQRYRRFEHYRINYAVYGALVIGDKEKGKGK
jgi:hypothetical protein